MKAVLLTKHGGTDSLQYVTDFPEPQAGPGEVIVRVHATGLNQVDQVTLAGYPGIAIPLPHIQGGDIAGTVASLGPGAEGVNLGKRVLVFPIVTAASDPDTKRGQENLAVDWQFYGMHLKGGHCEYVSVPVRNLIALPDNVSFTDAVQLPVAGLTAQHGLGEHVGKLRHGQHFFIWGGSGGLGSIAIQLASNIGAVVHATGGSPQKLARMRELGVTHVYNRHEMSLQEIAIAVREQVPQGIDLILDYVGPQTFPTSFGMLRKGGTLAFCGMLTGVETSLHLQQAYLRQLSLLGFYLGTRTELELLVGKLADGSLKAVIAAEFDLADTAKAHELMNSGEQFGKIVIRVP